MCRIIFWNTQNASSGDKGENKEEALITLSRYTDLIILCEISGQSEDHWGTEVVPGFSMIHPSYDYGNYRKDTTYRYVMLCRDTNASSDSSDDSSTGDEMEEDSLTNVCLIDTGKSRPALYFEYKKVPCLVIHAPSKTDSTGAQKSAIRTALSKIEKEGLAAPLLIFGDLNVDAKDDNMLDRFLNGTPGHVGVAEHYANIWRGTDLRVEKPKEATRPDSGKILDWLIADKSVQNATASIFDVNEIEPVDSISEDEWKGTITDMTDRSDHHAIVVAY